MRGFLDFLPFIVLLTVVGIAAFVGYQVRTAGRSYPNFHARNTRVSWNT